MKTILIPMTALGLMTLAACGEAVDDRAASEAAAPEAAAPEAMAPEAMAMENASHDAMHDGGTMDHAAMGHDMPAMIGELATAKGRIIEIEEGGEALMIDHGPIPGMGMEPMAMRFGMLRGADLGGYAPGDEIEFAVKVGRDGTARIAALCDAGEEGAGCLAAELAE